MVAAWSQQSGIRWQVLMPDEAELSVSARYELLAVLTEALTNVPRHAAARMVKVTVTAVDGRLIVSVQ
jgi:signal transduction histidine kinase